MYKSRTQTCMHAHLPWLCLACAMNYSSIKGLPIQCHVAKQTFSPQIHAHSVNQAVNNYEVYQPSEAGVSKYELLAIAQNKEDSPMQDVAC